MNEDKRHAANAFYQFAQKYRMNIKEYALFVIEKFYKEGYITSNEHQIMLDYINTLNDDALLISCTINGNNVDYREIMLSVGYVSAKMTVFTQEEEVDFSVNYNYADEKFVVEESN